MQVQDYGKEALFGDGILNGLAVSILLHTGAVFLMVIIPFMLSRMETSPPLCVVDLLVQDLAGGGGGAEAGAARLGDGKPEPPPPPEPESEMEPELEKPDAVYLSKVMEPPEAPPPVEKKIEEPKEKPKPKPRPQRPRLEKPTPKPRADTPDRSNPEPGKADTGEVPTADFGKGPGTETGSGTGLASAGSGPGTGAGSGGGIGTGHGPLDASFGSGNGPRFAKKAQPKYPRIARELGKQGTVLLRLTIDERGRLLDVEVLKPAGSGFDEEAVKAVKESSFSPARMDGRPIRCRAQLPIRFVLNNAETD